MTTDIRKAAEQAAKMLRDDWTIGTRADVLRLLEAALAEQPQPAHLIKGAWIDGGYVIATPASGVPARAVLDAVMRLAEQPQPEAVAVVTECEACFTPDVCQLRGKCDHYSAEWLRVAAPPPPAPQPEAPSGWRMVPAEPTKAMIERALLHDPSFTEYHALQVYYAMIDAAPPPAAPTPEPSDAVAEFARGIDAAARFVEKRLADYDAAHGSTDSDTGAREYPGTGDEYVCELAEIAEAIRGLAPPPAAPEPEAPFDGTAWARQFAAFDPPAAPEPSEAEVAAAMASLYRAMEPAAWPSEDEVTDALRAAAAARNTNPA